MTSSPSTSLTVPDGTQGGSKSWSIKRYVTFDRAKVSILMHL